MYETPVTESLAGAWLLGRRVGELLSPQTPRKWTPRRSQAPANRSGFKGTERDFWPAISWVVAVARSSRSPPHRGPAGDLVFGGWSRAECLPWIL